MSGWAALALVVAGGVAACSNPGADPPVQLQSGLELASAQPQAQQMPQPQLQPQPTRPLPAGQLPGIRLRSVDFSNPIRPVASDALVMMAAAKNEAVSFGLEITELPAPAEKAGPLTLRFPAMQTAPATDQIEPAQYTVYQVLSMPVDLNRAAFVRHTGLPATAQRLPRALLPLPLTNGELNLANLRDPRRPLDPRARAGGPGADPVLLWVDIAVPPTTKTGDYEATYSLMQGKSEVASAQAKLHVHDFLIPDDRHLLMVGRLEWDALVRLYGPQFETVTPNLLSRNDPIYAKGIKTLDALVTLGQQNRLQVVVPRLQPQVKWPAGAPPEVKWEDFDSVVSPWLKGTTFADHVPLGYWPLPPTDNVESYDKDSRAQYWTETASHFDQLDWLARAPIRVENQNANRIAMGFKLSERAAELLAVHPKVKVILPVEDDQLAFKSALRPTFLDPTTMNRLITAAPGLIYRTHLASLPPGVPEPAHWLRTDATGLIPYAGAGGDERDVRLWAWLARLRQAQTIQWGAPLPGSSDPNQPADPGEVVWFYPGKWFGVDEPLPTVQLKWLRQAEQDYEYLYLAWERGEQSRARVMARLVTKPVQIDQMVAPDPTYSLMSGTTDPAAWTTVKTLLAESILLRPPGKLPEAGADIDLNGRVVRWIEPQEKPLMLGRTAQWGWSVQQGKQGGSWVDLRVGLDVYNAADERLIGDLQWRPAPAGWQIKPQPIAIPPTEAVNVYHVARFAMDANVDLEGVTRETRQPAELALINALDAEHPHTLKMVLPVASSVRREGQPLDIDGNLSEWNEDDALQDGPLVKLFDRPMMQKQELQWASTASHIYSTWGPQNFYLAFMVEGMAADQNRATRNYAVYPDGRRAWGEDLCEVLIQPIYADNALGPVTHLVVKPHGQLQVESKLDPRYNANPWQTVVGVDVRYGVDAIKDGIWRGELAIPWDVINDPQHQGIRPGLLRFNFVQHKTTTGESASWAGPVDFGRDDAFTGLLNLREPAPHGPGGSR